MKNLKKLSRENLKNLKGGGGPYKPCDDMSDLSNCYASLDDCMYSNNACEVRRSCSQTLYCG
ncbi:hypothetical protein LPB85_10835 [Chryseobacterium sp. LC2016-27]|uniref:bacteriocin-like protein n=1 Tax=Chryseobacterium sp. LC2016-27 TaxID=2897326 RepID=UPI001E3A986E|nr:hypothetical protein [Chryseobacterium sp. LC2016-27]MCD0455929.1 hypothetical protein [Chryseobacterium sp. LC2016-27]